VTTKLHLVFESPGPNVLDFPDNLTVSPNGRVVLCEDNINDNYVRVVTPSGGLFDLALNRLTSVSGANRSNDEFAGACFSPDGGTLFVNIQATNGMTFAIWGPWAAVDLA
jgi:secreted PhoX family phosphatase